jgi:hypothetical protein
MEGDLMRRFLKLTMNVLRDPDESASELSKPLPDMEQSLLSYLFQTAKQVPSMKQSIMVLDQSIGAVKP